MKSKKGGRYFWGLLQANILSPPLPREKSVMQPTWPAGQNISIYSIDIFIIVVYFKNKLKSAHCDIEKILYPLYFFFEFSLPFMCTKFDESTDRIHIIYC